jgi:PiT family inorganic phosphate transporter
MNHVIVAMPLIVALVMLAFAFDFINGLHDAANSIATVVSTKLLSPVQAVLFAAVFNFAAYWFFGLKVAETVGKGIIDKDVVTPHVIFGALVGAMAGTCSPGSRAFLLLQPRAGGGPGGRRADARRPSSIVWSGIIKTTSFIVLAPVLGMVLAMSLMLITAWLFMKATAKSAEGVFKKLHLVSSAAYSLGTAP